MSKLFSDVLKCSAYILLCNKRLKQVGNSRQSSSIINSLGSFSWRPIKGPLVCGLSPSLCMITLNPYLFAPPGPTNITTMKRQHTQFCLTFVYSLSPRPQAYHEIPTHRGILVQSVFLKFIPLFLMLIFQIIYQYLGSEST